MKLITAACGTIGTSPGLAVGVATTPSEVEAGGFVVNGNHAPHTTTIRTNSNKDPVRWRD